MEGCGVVGWEGDWGIGACAGYEEGGMKGE